MLKLAFPQSRIYIIIFPKQLFIIIVFFNALFYFIFFNLCKVSFIYFFNFIFKLYISVLVLPNIKMNPPQVYTCSTSWTLLPPPSPYHPSELKNNIVMFEWHHRVNGHEFEQIPGDSKEQGNLGAVFCSWGVCSPWGRKELDMTEWLNNSTENVKLHNGKRFLISQENVITFFF